MLFPRTNTDDIFDLDLALTMPELDSTSTETNSNGQQQVEAESTAEEVIEGMPTVVVGGGHRCTVCMEGFGLDVVGKQISCGHVFHFNCVAHWISLHNSCPLCRFKVFV
ncbi:hypothetical protein ACJIZ3_021222 [Penstemon smallii]|uniref:RING-type E3 ubiquitin transferase n=1 Tax=Penstemon smallii TaxID=265156 RepID=A0ABD3SLS2_9LAMI